MSKLQPLPPVGGGRTVPSARMPALASSISAPAGACFTRAFVPTANQAARAQAYSNYTRRSCGIRAVCWLPLVPDRISPRWRTLDERTYQTDGYPTRRSETITAARAWAMRMYSLDEPSRSRAEGALEALAAFVATIQDSPSVKCLRHQRRPLTKTASAGLISKPATFAIDLTVDREYIDGSALGMRLFIRYAA